MSASIQADMDMDLGPIPILSSRFSRQRERRQVDRAQLRLQLRVVQEMLGDLQAQTLVGQRHTMDKMIGVLREQVNRGLFAVGTRNQQMLRDLLEQLAREAGRPVPQFGYFRDRAEPLVALLMAST
jgi:hypothetical protein